MAAEIRSFGLFKRSIAAFERPKGTVLHSPHCAIGYPKQTCYISNPNEICRISVFMFHKEVMELRGLRKPK